MTKLRWLDQYLGGKDLEHITRGLIDRITDAKLSLGHSNATVNRTLELLRAILRKCVNDWEWLNRAPSVRMLKEPTRRIRFLTRDEAQALLRALPEHLADMAEFSLATGLRAANVTGLQWSQLDLARRLAWIHPDQAKTRRAIPVPLNAEAAALISKQVGKHLTHVFSFQGRPITQVSTKAWYAALERSGVTDFRWHDLRHTWASWHVQNGTPLIALQELGGWARRASNTLRDAGEGRQQRYRDIRQYSDQERSQAAARTLQIADVGPGYRDGRSPAIHIGDRH